MQRLGMEKLIQNEPGFPANQTEFGGSFWKGEGR